MKRNAEIMKELSAECVKRGSESVFEENPGNHFVDSELRTAKGICWILENDPCAEANSQESAGTADTGHSSKDKAAPALTANFQNRRGFLRCNAKKASSCQGQVWKPRSC